jgi:cytochrome P450
VDEDLQFKGYTIPRGTIVSMSTYLQHRNSTIFPDPETFDPGRLLAPNSAKLEKYLVNFSKGTRGCLGIGLAKTEIYATLAALFRRFDLELYQTDRSDVDMAHDFFVPHTRLDSKGIRVLVTGVADR